MNNLIKQDKFLKLCPVTNKLVLFKVLFQQGGQIHRQIYDSLLRNSWE